MQIILAQKAVQPGMNTCAASALALALAAEGRLAAVLQCGQHRGYTGRAIKEVIAWHCSADFPPLACTRAS